jgi:excisionase family DNA binding protein
MDGTTQAEPRIVRFDKAAVMLGVSLSTVRRLIAAGRLKKVSVSARGVGIPFESIHRMLDGSKPESALQ